MNRPFLLAMVAAVLTTGLLMTVPSGNDPNESALRNAPWADQEQARLEKALLHAEPGSDRAFKMQLKLDRLEAWRQDQPQPGFPDEFAKVLHDMRVPSDRTFPEYQPGYRFRELDKARQNVRFADKTLSWIQRGPGNVAGRARVIVVDPIDPEGRHLVHRQCRRRHLENHQRRRHLAGTHRRAAHPGHPVPGHGPFQQLRDVRRYR